MNLTQTVLLLTAITNAVIGTLVYVTNPQRGQNRQFFIFALSMSSWGVGVFAAVSAPTAEAAHVFIRVASAAAAVCPYAFHLLCLSIESPSKTLLQLLVRARVTLVLSVLAIGLCFTGFFLRHVIMPGSEGSTNQFPEAVYGPGFILFNLYFPFVFGSIIVHFFRSRQSVQGMQRVESQYVLLAMALTLVIGTATNIVLPTLTGSSQSQPFGPLSLIALNAIIAYGIATRRIMDVAYILRRAAAYALLSTYLVLLYAVVWVAAYLFFTRLVGTNLPFPHLLAALVLAFSVAPAHGSMQRFANRLFVTRQTMDVGSTVGELNDMLQAIRTMPNLLQRFSQTVAGSVGTDSVAVYLRNHSGFERKYPPEADPATARFEQDDPLVSELVVSRDPIVTDELSRLRPTPKLNAISRRLTELDAAVAAGIRTPEGLEGILMLGPKLSGRIYGAVELNALPILCDQLAVALENAELYTQTRDDKIYNEVLLDNLTSGVIAANVDGRITVINREAQRITGLARVDCIDQPFDILPRPLAQALDETFTRGQGLRDHDVVIQGNTEHETPIRVGSSVFTSHKGNLLGALAVFTDLTTMRKLENQVRRTDRLASIGTLAAGMAHEIKNPLVTVKTFTQLLPERYQDEDFRGTFSTLIGQEVKRIDSIVNQLLNFARPAKPDLSPIKLHDVLEKSLRLIEQQLKQKSITLKQDLAATNDFMLADANLLQQAVINFLLNAIDSMDDGGEITVTTDMLSYDRRTHREFAGGGSSNRIKLTIRDTGVGIRPEDVSHIFDPFFTTKGHGTGLGLSVSHGIIQDHGGDIDVESALGKGTAFHIVFPVRVPETVS